MSSFIFANNATSYIVTPLSTTDVSVSVFPNDGDLFPATTGGNFFSCRLYLESSPETCEIVYVTAKSGNDFTLVRGAESSVARAWIAGTKISNIVTAGLMNTLSGGYGTNPTLTITVSSSPMSAISDGVGKVIVSSAASTDVVLIIPPTHGGATSTQNTETYIINKSNYSVTINDGASNVFVLPPTSSIIVGANGTELDKIGAI